MTQRTAQLLQANALLQQEILVRARAEEQIHFQANILSQVSDAVIAIDNEFRVTYWNRGAERLYGVKADEIIARQLQESHQYRWLNPEDEQATYNALAATGSWQGENIHVKNNKEEIYVDSSVSLLKDNSGTTIGLLAVIRDITERKQAQELIKTSAAELNQIFTMLPTFVWKFCPSSHQFIYASQMITELSGLSREAFLQNYHIWNERVDSGKESQEAIEIAWQAIAHGEPYRIVYLFHTLHKGSRWFEITARPVYESGVLYYYGSTTDITERKQAEVELRESEARFRQLAENINEIFLICTIDAQQMLYISPAYERIWGRTCESLYQQPRSWLEAIHPDDYERVQAAFARRINGEEFQEEYRIIRRDGDIRWIFDRSFGVYDEAGQLVYFVGLVEDISDRKQAEVALRESEARFRTMADNAPVMIWVNGTDKLCHYCNKRWLEFTGRTLEQERGNGWTEDIHPEDLQRCLDIYFTAFDTRQPFTIEYRLQRFDGEYRWILDTGTPLYNGDGSFAGYIGSCIDITERELSQQKIREQAALLDVATDAILVQDLENKILFWNQSAEQVYGWKVEEALGKNANELLYKDSAKPEEVVQTVTLKGEWQGELSQVRKNGKEIIVESRWTLVRDKQGQPKSILTVNTDITEKRQLEAHFFRIQRLESLGTLASGIAHDLNNILAPTLMSAQLLQKKISDVQSQQLLATVESSAKRGASLVQQVLSFARGVAGERTILQLKHLILEIERIVKQTFPKSIQFYTDVVSDLWMISGNSTQLHQVLMNLVVNARDAMPNGGTVSITAENFVIDEYYALMNVEATVGSYIVVTVADTGTGIPPEIIDKIFDPFFTTKEIGLGTGLGLSTVMGIIKNHGGFVTVESEVGKGSTFGVYLPAVNGMETTQPTEEMKLPRGHGELILVVDDELHLRETTKILLESYNYKVLTASDGIEALTMYVQHKDEISVVLMDMMMPNMDGAITICTLQKINPHLKVIAVSGLPSNDQLAYAARINIKTFLSKPYTLRELLNIINSVLSAS
ncbi:PAS domain S-box protein [Brasilonema sp. UFV-L1]|uniref:PAS domain-containing hybrid sensor histidine kinase/response regulator n=1 Tax=Brasilonema sp. UFV-L1 TaxID=2234130 RepID=UPI001B7CEC40